MIGVNFKILKDFGELGIDEAHSIFIKDNNLKKLLSEEYIITYMTKYLKNKESITSNEDLIFIGKDSNNGYFVFEILGKKSSVNNIRRHEVLYIKFAASIEINNGSENIYIRLNTDDLENYINAIDID